MSELERLLTEVLGRPPGEVPLFRQALTHPSAAGDAQHPLEHNERLEFLGDAVLDLVVAEAFYHRFPDRSEGELSRMRAAVVCEPTLARVGRRLGLGPLLYLSHGEEASGGRDRPSVLAAAVEAVIGALYLTAGLDAARAFVLRGMAGELEEAAAGRLFEDYKTHLQEVSRRVFGQDPQYRLVGEEGPDHRKTFHVEVHVGGRVAGKGSGRSKKEAEQAAAADALRRDMQES